MRELSTDLKYFILIGIALILALIPTYAHHGSFLIDCGREAYYPTQVLLGKVLYKDILNIYGPFSYMFNALLFKVFGISLNVLYLAGCACAFLISILIYLIAKRLLPIFVSFSIAILTISVGVLNIHLSNFIFPYSYAMLYGLVAFLISVWFLLKYQSETKIVNLYLSGFFAGLCVSSKYEFILYLTVILYAMIRVKPLKIKEYYYAIFSILFMPIFCFGILFLQGLTVNDLITTGSILNKMAYSQTLNYFYHRQGVFLSKAFMKLQIKIFFAMVIPLIGFLCGFKSKNRFLSFIFITLSIFLIIRTTNSLSYSLLPLLVVLLAILNFKNLKTNLPLQLLVLSAILFSTKVFWGLITENYGAFFISYLLIAFLALISDIFKDKNINYKAIGLYILLVAGVLSYRNLSIINVKSYLIQTPRGKIYTTLQMGSASGELMDYIIKNTKKKDEIVILPEGVMINFLTGRKSDNFYTSLIPLYVEVFGDENLIKHFSETKPEYIIFNNYNTNEYYFPYICQDYAVSFCNFVAKNYIQEKIIDRAFRYVIFKRR